MLTLLTTVAVLFFSAIAVVTGLQFAILCALVVGTAYFGFLLVRQFSVLPTLNLMTFIATGSGLFYFLGGTLAVGAHIVFGENPYSHVFERWKNYDVGPMAGAIALAFACSLVTIAVSQRVTFRHLSRLTSAADFYAGEHGRVYADRTIGITISVAVGVMSALLLLTGTLKPQGATDLSVNNIVAGNAWVVLFSTLAPASYLLFAYQLVSRHARAATKLIVLACAFPVGLGTLMLGRRYVIAALVVGIVGLIAYRGVRLRAVQWAAAGVGALALFLAISAPFMAFRQAQLGNSSVGVGQLLSGAFNGDRVAGVQKLSLADVAAMSAARGDLMSDLAQLTSRIPPSAYRFGTGLASQFALIVPNAMWPGKQHFLAAQMYNDFQICRDASLPPTDLAGTLVLYSFGEFGWLAPAWFCGVVLAFVWLADLMVGAFRSFTFNLLTVSSVLVYGVVADNQWGGSLLPLIRFLLIAGLLIAVARAFTLRPVQRPVLAGRPPAARAANARRGV